MAAEDVRIGRRVAVKQVLDASAATVKRFEREAKVTARLQHPGIVPIYEMGRWSDGTPFYVMRLVDGITLHEAVLSRPTLAERLALLSAMIAATEAVAFAHDNDVIHRDLTPRNILVGAHGDTVVIDWGLAKDLSNRRDEVVDGSPYRDKQVAPELTHAGAVIGTARFMSPEQAIGQPVDKTGDVYALGAVLYHLITAEPPYASVESAHALEAVRGGPPPALESIEPHVPRDLASIARRAMAREPAQRFADAGELARELRRFQTGLVVESHHYSRAERARRWLRKRRALAIAAVSAIVVAGVIGGLALSRVLAERSRAEQGERSAITQRETAERTSNALLIEQGRQELLRGEKLRALAYLDEAYRRGADSIALRVLLADATRELAAFERRVPCGSIVRGIVVTADETHAAAACGDRAVIWRISDGHPVATLGPIPDGFAGISFIAADRRVLTWGAAGLRTWDATTGALQLTLDGAVTVNAAALPDGSLITGSDNKGTFSIWSGATGERRRTVDTGFGAMVRVTVIPEQRAVLAGDPVTGKAGLYDLETGEVRAAEVFGRVFNGDVNGNLLVTCGREVRIWNLATREQTVFPGHADAALSCHFSRDGSRLLTTSADGTARLWEVPSRRVVRTVTHGGLVADGGFVGSSYFATAGAWDGNVKVWNAAGALLASFYNAHDRTHPRFAFAAGRMLIGTDEGDVVIRRITTPIGTEFDAPAGEQAVPVNDIGTRVVTGTANGPDARLWDVTTRRSIVFSEVAAMANAGGRVVTASKDGTVRASAVEQMTELRRFKLSAEGSNLRLSRDGRRLLVDVAGVPEIWDIDSGTQLWRLEGRNGGALDRTGQLVAAWSNNQRIEILDVERRTRRTEIVLDHALGNGLVFASEGRLVILDGEHMTLWDTTTGRRLLAVPASTFALSENGRFVSARAPDGMVRTWSTVDAALLGSFVSPTFGITVPSPDGELVADTGDGGGSLFVRATATGQILASWPMPPRDFVFLAHDVQTSLDIPAWTPDSSSVLLRGPTFVRWEVPRETRDPNALHAAVDEHLAWTVRDGQLVRLIRQLSGRVLRHGKPVTNATVFVDREVPGQAIAVTRTDGNGRFAIELHKGRRYEVRAVLDNVAFSMPQPVDCAAANTTTEIELDLAGAITGRVRDDGGAPLAGVRVTAHADGDEGETVTAADGSFTMGALSGGHAYTLRVFEATGIELPSARAFPTPRVANGSDTVRDIALVIDHKATAATRLDVGRPHQLVNPATDRALALASDNTLRLVPRSEAPSWKITPMEHGVVRLTVVSVGEHMSLDGDHLAATGPYSGQAWRLRREPDGTFRLSTIFQTDANSLDASKSVVTMAPSLDQPAQRWRLVPVP
jgi:eukaryotic-like serine/threonine-protein kinase